MGRLTDVAARGAGAPHEPQLVAERVGDRETAVGEALDVGLQCVEQLDAGRHLVGRSLVPLLREAGAGAEHRGPQAGR